MAPYSAEGHQNYEPANTYSVEASNEVSYNSNSPFSLLRKYGNQMKRLRSGKHQELGLEMEKTEGLKEEGGSSCPNRAVLTAASIMTMAKIELDQYKAPKNTDFSIGLPNPCACDSDEHVMHIHRAKALLEAVGRFSNQQYDGAEELISYILSVSYEDHPVERLITSFAHDIRERINVVNNSIDLEREVVLVDVEQTMTDIKAAMRTCEQRLPFCQIINFTAVQIILDHTDSAERIHFIDIGIKLGSHWIVVMIDLANRKNHPLKQLKITAVCKPNDNVEEISKLLTTFADYMKLPFVFKILHSQPYELNKDQFELESDELVVVYLEYCLTCLSDSPTKLEGLIMGVKSLSPHLMVFSEIEANTSGSTFFNRFEDALFICCAKFDCLEHCLRQNSLCRELLEKLFFQEVISKGVMCEEEGSFRRRLNIESWREYFTRFGIVEAELSQRAIYQACLMVRESLLWRYCTMTMNGKCLLMGWNEVPLHSVSAWKFQHD